jgi:hypothetical protein
MMTPLKELRRRDCARRHWRPYRGRVLQRQRLPGCPRNLKPPESADKLLMRLNVLGGPGIAWRRFSVSEM